MALPKILRHLIDRENPHSTPQVHTGSILIWPGATIPEGYLLCDGQAVSRTQYAALFAAIGTTYGTGDGSSTFALPDLTGRVAVGKSGEAEFSALGKAGGEKAVSHLHGDGTLYAAFTMDSAPKICWHSCTDDVLWFVTDYSGQLDHGKAGGPMREGTSVYGNTGSTSVSALQPYLTLQYIIKI